MTYSPALLDYWLRRAVLVTRLWTGWAIGLDALDLADIQAQIISLDLAHRRRQA